MFEIKIFADVIIVVVKVDVVLYLFWVVTFVGVGIVSAVLVTSVSLGTRFVDTVLA